MPTGGVVGEPEGGGEGPSAAATEESSPEPELPREEDKEDSAMEQDRGHRNSLNDGGLNSIDMVEH